MAYNPSDFDKETSLDLYIPPIITIDYTDPDTLLKWAIHAYETLEEVSTYRREWQRANICRYKGYYSQYEPVVGGASQAIAKEPRQRWPRIISNHTRDLVDQKVAKTMKLNVDYQVVPADSSEQGDKAASVVAGKVLKSIDYAHPINEMRSRKLRRAVLFGEAFEYVCWDEDAGEVMPEFRKKLRNNEDIPFTDETGAIVEDEDGNKLKLRILPRLGDVRKRLLDPEDIHLIPGPRPLLSEVPGCIIKKHVHITELKAQYANAEHVNVDDIRPTRDLQKFNLNTLDEDALAEHVLVLDFYFRASRFLPEGLYFRITPDVVLETPCANPIPYSVALEHSETGNLPITRITDIDIEGELHGWSSMNDINQLQNVYDKLTSLINRNIFLFCHPKWIVPRGGANLTQLSNGSFIVEASGPWQPFLAAFQAVSQDIFAFRQSVKEEMGQIFGVYGPSRGEAPKGTRSASQLMIYDEQEEEARAPFRKKFEEDVTSMAGKVLAIVSEKYEKDDNRLIKIVGDNRDWLVEPFDVEDLRKDYSIRVTPSSVMPDNKYARIRTMLEIWQVTAPLPGGPVFTREQFLEALEFGQQEKFINYSQVAVTCAQAENEMLIKGKEVASSELFEDLITHWLEHAKLFQSLAYRSLPDKVRRKAEDHMLGTEANIMLQAGQNPGFKLRVSQLSDFPYFYVMPASPPVPLNMAPEPQQNGASQPGIASQPKIQLPAMGETQPQ